MLMEIVVSSSWLLYTICGIGLVTIALIAVAGLVLAAHQK